MLCCVEVAGWQPGVKVKSEGSDERPGGNYKILSSGQINAEDTTIFGGNLVFMLLR